MKDQTAYAVKLTAQEADHLQRALDLYSRLQMGQAWIIADYVDPAQSDIDGRLAFKDKLRELQPLITGDPRPGISRYPTERHRERGELVRDLFEHIRYARTGDPFCVPLAHNPGKVSKEPL
ncbi:hypothetical protein SAMN04488058_101319 [Deinococcus reticulitermitis]|uniref:Uncharacterized protein n=1 Tax=Deinococcus reticulitermitis TaxID=856736 RepID=A0A1H6SSS9_9DEIO|nr:hypothetical protein [Deinococcus reticulitermitis]SEI67837.1 hypothetical protein SAMN04488058_101319 [Deinococcus reticulitermitis]